MVSGGCSPVAGKYFHLVAVTAFRSVVKGSPRHEILTVHIINWGGLSQLSILGGWLRVWSVPLGLYRQTRC